MRSYSRLLVWRVNKLNEPKPQMNRSIEVGDLVIFKSSSPRVMKNQIGIIVSDKVLTKYQKDNKIIMNWYVALFGDVKLVISIDMIEKI